MVHYRSKMRVHKGTGILCGKCVNVINALPILPWVHPIPAASDASQGLCWPLEPAGSGRGSLERLEVRASGSSRGWQLTKVAGDKYGRPGLPWMGELSDVLLTVPQAPNRIEPPTVTCCLSFPPYSRTSVSSVTSRIFRVLEPLYQSLLLKAPSPRQKSHPLQRKDLIAQPGSATTHE